MAKITEVKPRAELDPVYQWDLTTIFESDEAWQQAYEAVKGKIAAVADYKGTLTDVASVKAAFEQILALDRELEKVYIYTSLKHDQETQNAKYTEIAEEADTLVAAVEQALAWFEPEVLALPDDVKAALKADTDYGHYFDALLKSEGHILSAETEALLADALPVLSNSEKTFDYLSDTDLKFGKVKTADGSEVTLSHGSYGALLEATDRATRKDAFQKMYAAYRGVNHTMASIMTGNVKHHNFNARVRHYDSARQAAMAANHIPEVVYDTLIESVHKGLPLLHEYVALRKQVLGIDDLHPYDLYTPLAGEPSLSFTFEEAKEEAFKALAPLGDDYLTHLKRAFDEHWIDVYENISKRSGAYSSGVYDTNAFVLLNWQDSLNDLYTLVHELGHSMHSTYAAETQPYVYGDYPIFLAEIASTTNENILTHYLLDHYQDKDTQIYLLTNYLDAVKGTIFRQTQFAEFEDLIHKADQDGTALTADFLNQTYGDLNKQYYGPALAEDEDIAYEWSRIPHFYYDYYVYQYSTGFAAANTLAENVTSGDPAKVDAYLTYLKSGSSDYPVEIMKRAGVDMTKPDYIERTFKTFEERLHQLRDLLL